jgi:aldose 1-epimerase
VKGFNKKVWNGEMVQDGVCFTMMSEDGEEGFPGQLTVTATYLLKGNRLEVDMTATVSKFRTPVNLAQHSYFNLGGHDSGSVYDHSVMIQADAYTPVDDDLIPTGEIEPVANTVMDFTSSTLLGPRLQQMEADLVTQLMQDDASCSQVEALKKANGSPLGYDHNYVLSGDVGSMKQAAVVFHEGSGRVLIVETNAPGVQFYTGNFLDKVKKADGLTIYIYIPCFPLVIISHTHMYLYVHFQLMLKNIKNNNSKMTPK